MLAFLKRLFRIGQKVGARKPGAKKAPPVRRAVAKSPPVKKTQPEPATTRGLAAKHAELLDLLDGKGHFKVQLNGREQRVLAEVGRRVEACDLVLPHLPTTSLAAMDMAAKPSADIAELVELMATDPVLSSELLKISNSVLYAGQEECRTLRQAVVRMGMQALRSMILAISMRSVMLHDKMLATAADAIWRQTHSVGLIARSIGPLLGVDGERAFLIGLLHDIGKVALLSTVRKEMSDGAEVSPSLLGQVFYFHHENAGEAIARAWKLPDEVVAVAGCHHHFDKNEGHERSAAMASLAHRIDLQLALGASLDAEALQQAPEFEYLKIDAGQRTAILSSAASVFARALPRAAA